MFIISVTSTCYAEAHKVIQEAKAKEAEKVSKVTPFQLVGYGDVQLFGSDYEVKGIRLNLTVGRSKSVSGIDFGLINIVEENVKGLQVGFQNFASVNGIQIGFMNTPG